MSESQEDSPKIIVDDDWKEQVQKEKEAAAASSEPSSADATKEPVESTEPVTTAASDTASGSEESLPDPPPASFEMLISMMFTQAMSMLGQIPDPTTGQVQVNKPYAKHYIDTLDMLSEKTKGNLSDDESKMLSEALHALRMAFVGAQG